MPLVLFHQLSALRTSSSSAFNSFFYRIFSYRCALVCFSYHLLFCPRYPGLLSIHTFAFSACGFVSLRIVAFRSRRLPSALDLLARFSLGLRLLRLCALAFDVSGIASLPFCLADFVPFAFGFCRFIRCIFGCDLLNLSPPF
jgi:hypothetical protein